VVATVCEDTSSQIAKQLNKTLPWEIYGREPDSLVITLITSMTEEGRFASAMTRRARPLVKHGAVYVPAPDELVGTEGGVGSSLSEKSQVRAAVTGFVHSSIRVTAPASSKTSLIR
jgi:hypothetical protein